MKGQIGLRAVICFALLGCSVGVAAQSKRLDDAEVATLSSLADTFQRQAITEKQAAARWARGAGIPLRRVLPDGRILELQRVPAGRPPQFYITNNTDAADTVSTDELWPGGSSGLNLDGSGLTIGEWDGGAIYAHTDFDTRLTQVDGATEVSNHSTHVAGTLIGSGAGLLPNARGMAYAASLDAYDWNSDVAEMAAAASSDLLVSNHSYGIAAGWLYIGDPEPETWWWIGGSAPTDVEDANFGYYDSESQAWDQVAFNAPYYLIVKSAGNDRTDTGPAPGEMYTVVDQDGNPLFVSDLPRDSDCAPAGYDCLPTHSVAKNILTVGAVDDIPGGYAPLSGADTVVMAPFSSWGPTDDGRIKPDLVGNGVFLLSTWSELPFYAASAGTSMSAPNVSGSLLLLQQHYENTHGADQYMRAATLKALAIHTADEAGDAPGPDYAFGWGLLNAQNAAGVISNEGNGHEMIEATLADGGSYSTAFTASSPDAVVVATLVWADPPATPVAPALDPTDLMLVNDLDLRVVRNATTHFPWVLDPSSPAAAATRGDNFRDNVEQVIVNGQGSGSYTVQVTHKGTLLDNLPQDFSLVISERLPLPDAPALLVDEDFSGGLPAGWSVHTASGVDWHIQVPIAADARYDNLTGAGGNFAMVDNNFINISNTSLQLPAQDFSGSIAVVLRFMSYFSYDTFETLHVETSTDGGSSWNGAWQFQGFNPLPTQYVLDLTTALAGAGSGIIRFRFDSEGFASGDLWQVDNVQLESYAAGNPDPGAICSGTDVDVQQHTFVGMVQCVASNYVLMHNQVVVQAGAQVEVDAPSASFDNGFTVELGGELTVQPPP